MQDKIIVDLTSDTNDSNVDYDVGNVRHVPPTKTSLDRNLSQISSNGRASESKHSRKRKLLATIHESRLNEIKRRRLESITTNLTPQSESDQMHSKSGVSIKKQIDTWRQEKHKKYRRAIFESRPSKVITLADLNKRQEEQRAEEFSWRSKKNNNELGKLILTKTNQYRKKRNLPLLVWDDELAYIGYSHSFNMAFKGHPFNHNGFSDRAARSRFSAMAENLAMNNMQTTEKIANCAVNGWIASPGHNKNLIGAYNYCGIGVVTATNGCVYMTQLFGS